MMTMTVVAEQTFAPPRPGVWFLDPTHFTRPVTRFHAELFPEQMIAGFSEGLRRYGSLLEYLDCGLRQRLLLLLPPAGRRAAGGGRASAARGVGRARSEPPRDPSAAGDERDRVRAQALARGPRALGPRGEAGGDPRPSRAAGGRADARSATSDLLAYLDRCRENQKRGAYIHHLFNMPALLPIGDFLVHAREWTGRPGARAARACCRARTRIRSAPTDELERLLDAVRRGSRRRRAVLDSAGEPAEVLAALRSLPGRGRRGGRPRTSTGSGTGP